MNRLTLLTLLTLFTMSASMSCKEKKSSDKGSSANPQPVTDQTEQQKLEEERKRLEQERQQLNNERNQLEDQKKQQGQVPGVPAGENSGTGGTPVATVGSCARMNSSFFGQGQVTCDELYHPQAIQRERFTCFSQDFGFMKSNWADLKCGTNVYGAPRVGGCQAMNNGTVAEIRWFYGNITVEQIQQQCQRNGRQYVGP